MTEPAHQEPITICSEKTLRGAFAGNVRVKPGGVLWLRGLVNGDVWIERGAP